MSGTPYIKITLGKIGNVKSESFTIGDNQLVSASVQLNEGYALSNCEFSVRDPKKELLDKYLAYIESVDGLDDFRDYPDTTSYPEINQNPSQDEAFITGETKLIFNSTKGTVFNDGIGSQGNRLDPTNNFGCAMRYNNPAAAKQFGTVGMINYLNFGDRVKVTNPANGKSCICTVQDWGPNPSLADRGIDLFTKAFNYLTNTTGYQAALNIGIINNLKVELVSKREPTVITTAKTLEQKKKSEEIVANRSKSKAQATTSKDKVLSTISSAKTPKQESLPEAKSLSGCQITVELGFNGQTISAYSFIHTSLSFDFFNPDLLTFGGSSAVWVMAQRVKNTAYQKLTFKKVAEKICKSYGMTLEMSETGPYYEYFPQQAKSDLKFLADECNRLGFRMQTVGKKVTIAARSEILKSKQTFTLEYGINMGLDFNISHEASSNSGGARSVKSNNSTGELKFEIDPDTGEIKQQRRENIKGMGADSVGTVSGSSRPLPTPKTDGLTVDMDNQRKSSEERVKGIKASADFPTDAEALILTPDTPFKTKGISKTADRFWVVESVEHNFESGKFSTSVSLYSPLKNKNPTPKINNPTSIYSSNANNTPLQSNFDPSAPKFIRPVGKQFPISSPYGPRGGRLHAGLDIGCPVGTPIIASASGVISSVITGCRVGDKGCGGRYGNFISISHSGGWETRYAHLNSVSVTVGQQVLQGQLIGTTGNSGSSTAPHAHVEIRKNGNSLNPLKFYQ
ncbi:peptidoglycan DD-metalloendopeptidase family protein [Nostoc sp. CCY 9925]|uniref:peptidoglycan DD-metalloendopeptidase family protein n=1 Tax=Nostoc sp. CCY 9925 TaxID=3103865 RepID=UPI0039C6320D